VTGQTFAIIGSLFAALGLQTFWIARSLDRIEKRLDRIEDTFLKDYGERIAKLEAR
jgi:hypothetical protein